MLSRDLVRQIRRLHLRARRAVEDLLGGEYRSVFKGAGISFEEVREYQAGDDIRSIDWNVTARMGHPFVKRFIEERELTVVLVIDISQSLEFGTLEMSKRAAVAEMAALIAFSALTNGDRVGLLLVSDHVEKWVPPRKGTRHGLRLMRDILYFRPQHAGTALAKGLDSLNRFLRRRAIVFCFSDFQDEGYEPAFRRTARRHDLVPVLSTDPREIELPDMGLVRLEDAETGQQMLVDSSDPRVRKLLNERLAEPGRRVKQLARQTRSDLIEVSGDGQHLDALVRFFRLRQRRWGR